MQLKKFTRKDRHGNMMSFEFDVPQANVPAMQSIPMYDHPGDPKGTDTVPAWLTPGEFVVNKEATEMFGPTIKKMNDVGRQKQNQNKAMYAQEGTKVFSRSSLDEDEDFQVQLNQMLDKYEGSEFSKDKLYNMIAGESSFDPTAKNPNSSATGLFQFTDTAINDLKDQGKIDKDFTTSDVASMSPADQLKLYETYLDRWKYGGEAHLGIMQAAPGAYFEKFRSGDNKGDLNQEVFRPGSSNYELNPVWAGKDGKMTFASISDYYDSKAKKTTDKIPGVDVAQIKPQDVPSGAEVVTDTSLVPPVNISIPRTNMASMEPIPGPTSGNVAQYLNQVRGKNVVPRPAGFQNVIQPVTNLPDELSNQATEINPYPVRNGQVLTPEYLDALQDQDFGGMGADSAMFKTDQQAIIPKVADVYEDDAIMRPGAGRIDATMYPDAAMRPGDQRKDIVPKKPTFLERLEGFRDRLQAENEAVRAKKKETADMIAINEPPKSLTRMFKEYGMNEKQRADFLQKRGEEGLARKADQEKMTKLEPIEEGYDRKDEVAKAILNTTNNDAGPGPDQPGANNNTETVKDTGKKAPPAEQKKAEGFLKGLLGNVFDSKELKRMAIMYLGSRLLGYNHGGSLNFALKQYMERIDAKEAAGRKYATSAAAAKKFKPTSLAKFIQTGNYDDLEYLPTQLRETGNTKKFHGVNKQGEKVTVIGQEFKVGSGDNAETVYYDRNGTKINPLNFTENPIYVPKTDEYNQAMVKYQELFAKAVRDNQSNNIAGKKDGKNIYYDGMGVTGDAARIAEWALDNKVDLGDMPSLINLAYDDLVEDAKSKEYKPTSLIPYLNSLKIRQSVKGLDFLSLLRTEPKSREEKKRGYGKVVNSRDFERLRQNAINFMKSQNPDFQNVTDDNLIATEWFRAITEDWAALENDVKEQWERKANKADSTGFFEWAKSQLQVGE